MSSSLALFKFVVRAALNYVGFGVGGEFAVEVLPEVAKDVWQWWGKGRPPEQLQHELQQLAQLPPDEAARQAGQAVAEQAAERPETERVALTTYLSLIPAAIRQSQRRLSDPTGHTVSRGLVLEKAESLLPLLPARLSRFKPGERPLPNVDLELEELLGAGGFGEVWKAHNPYFEGVPPVALKFCLDPSAKDHLLRYEAAVLNQVMRQGKHPGIVPLLKTYLSADPPCLEYEFVAGGDLGGIIRDARPNGGIPPRQAAFIVREVAEAVGFAHRLTPPIVHRDLKPANILIQRIADGKLAFRVADFGIGGVAAAQAIGQTRLGVTRGQSLVSSLKGSYTPLYASPQQVQGEPPDPRDDVYSLGVIWYQLLTAEVLAGAPSGSAWKKHLAEKRTPAPLVELLEECINHKPADRPANAAILAERIAAIISKETLISTSVAQPRTIINSIGMKLTLVEPGTFLMGSPLSEAERQDDEHQHEVEITRSFYAGIYPVTQEHYQRIMGQNPSHYSSTSGKDKVRDMDTRLFPVENVSWEGAVEFCRRLSELPDERVIERTYRLPTEAEWEYVCRGGPSIKKPAPPFHFGNSLSATQANFDGNHPYGRAAKGQYLERPTAVGCYPPNSLGLHDLHGNVWEWCADWYGAEYYQWSPRQDPPGPENGERRVMRGGSWYNEGRDCRAAYRLDAAPGDRDSLGGFRVVLVFPART
jgi:formylglycine-generating enzyme required for sulfatase activity